LVGWTSPGVVVRMMSSVVRRTRSLQRMTAHAARASAVVVPSSFTSSSPRGCGGVVRRRVYGVVASGGGGARTTTRRGEDAVTMMKMKIGTRGSGRGMTTTTTTTHAMAFGTTGMVTTVAAVTAAAAAAAMVMLRARRTTEVRVTASRTPSTASARALEACAGIISQGYDAVIGLTNTHASTILSSLLRRDIDVVYQREVLEMPNGGHATLDWPLSVGGDADATRATMAPGAEGVCEVEAQGPPFVRKVFDQNVLVARRMEEEQAKLPADAPVLVLMSGIAGGSHDKYLKHFMKRARASGFRTVAFNCRGCAESPLTTPQFYSASYTGDIRFVVDELHRRFPNAPLLAIGWSLGANILTNFLGEEGSQAKLTAAAALCNPFDLNACDTALESGFFGTIYSRAMAKNMRKLFAPHENLFAGLPKYNPELVRNAKTVRDFDEAVTAVTFGFPTVDAYYEYSGSKNKIQDVAIPLMTVQALDDPIAVASAIPREKIEKNPNVILIETETGGHLGWEAGDEAPFGAPWPDKLVMKFFQTILMHAATTKVAHAEAPTERVEMSA